MAIGKSLHIFENGENSGLRVAGGGVPLL